MPRIFLTAALALLGAEATLPRGVAADVPRSSASLLHQIEDGFVQVYEKVAPSVVVIEAMKAEEEDRDEARGFDFFFQGDKEPGRDPGERPWKLPTRSEGSGFFIRADGYILTNYHVINDAEKLTVRTKDGRVLPAKVVGADSRTDVAVIRVEGKDFPAAEMGDSDKLRVGQLVCAIGTPFNQDFSFTVGWVSGKGRTNLLAPTSPTVLYEDYIQTDAFINPGNSGGPLFDVDGRVIGMNTLINGLGRGLAFAIPSNMLVEVSQQIITNGRVQRAWLGVRIETLSESPMLRERVTGIDRGVVVDTIEASAPAYKSELRPADVITEVDGVKVVAARDLQREILKKKVGDPVQLTVWRSGAKMKIAVTTGELPGELAKASNVPPAGGGVSKAEALGLRLKDAAKGAGAMVLEVVPGSAARKVDVIAGDVITEVEGRTVRDANGCAAAIGDRIREKGAKGVQLSIDRKGRRNQVVIPAEG